MDCIKSREIWSRPCSWETHFPRNAVVTGLQSQVFLFLFSSSATYLILLYTCWLHSSRQNRECFSSASFRKRGWMASWEAEDVLLNLLNLKKEWSCPGEILESLNCYVAEWAFGLLSSFQMGMLCAECSSNNDWVLLADSEHTWI